MTYAEAKQMVLESLGTPYILSDIIVKLDAIDTVKACKIADTLQQLMKMKLQEVREIHKLK